MSVPLRPARTDAPSVLLSEKNGQRIVSKSYAHCPLPLRETVGRWATHRECSALERLSFSDHAPRLISRVDRYTVESEYIAGTPLENLDAAQVDPALLADQVDSLLADLIRAGITHGDLGHDHWQEMGRESNLIWTGERLVAIDFAGSLPLRSAIPMVGRVAGALSHHDQLLKTKVAYHFPGPEPVRSVACDWPLGLWDLLRVLGKL